MRIVLDDCIRLDNSCGIDRQPWELVDHGSGEWLWFNDYADAAFLNKGFCLIGGVQYEPVLTAEPSSGSQLDMRCQGQGPGITYQEWSS